MTILRIKGKTPQKSWIWITHRMNQHENRIRWVNHSERVCELNHLIHWNDPTQNNILFRNWTSLLLSNSQWITTWTLHKSHTRVLWYFLWCLEPDSPVPSFTFYITLLCVKVKAIQVWNDTRVSKWWQNVHFWMTPFKCIFYISSNFLLQPICIYCLKVLYLSLK